MDIGNLHIQTAGETKEAIIKHIPGSHQIKSVIAQYQDKILSGRKEFSKEMSNEVDKSAMG